MDTYKNLLKKDKYLTGFTLIEMVVVVAVFLFVIGGAIGIFYSVVLNQRKILTEQEALNQISYAEEYMSKALRMAQKDTLGTCLMDLTGDQQYHAGFIYLLTRYNENEKIFKGIKFINPSDTANPVCQEFFLDTDGVLKELKNSNIGSQAVALTPPGLVINSVRFSVDGMDGTSAGCTNQNACGANGNTDNVQPRVTILLSVSIPGDIEGPDITCNGNTKCPGNDICDYSVHKCVLTRMIQTTVSQRNLNIR